MKREAGGIQSVSKMDMQRQPRLFPSPPDEAGSRISTYVNLCVSILRSPIMMLRSLAIRAGLLCVVLAPLATLASAQLKIAVVNVQKAMLDSDELKKVSADVEAKYKPKQDELL